MASTTTLAGQVEAQQCLSREAPKTVRCGGNEYHPPRGTRQRGPEPKHEHQTEQRGGGEHQRGPRNQKHRGESEQRETRTCSSARALLSKPSRLCGHLPTTSGGRGLPMPGAEVEELLSMRKAEFVRAMAVNVVTRIITPSSTTLPTDMHSLRFNAR